jgi:hypothetical protein
LDETGISPAGDASSAALWFAEAAGVSPSVAHVQVKTARVLARHLPATDQAWLDGAIGRDHVAVMVRAANPRVRAQISAAAR